MHAPKGKTMRSHNKNALIFKSREEASPKLATTETLYPPAILGPPHAKS